MAVEMAKAEATEILKESNDRMLKATMNVVALADEGKKIHAERLELCDQIMKQVTNVSQ